MESDSTSTWLSTLSRPSSVDELSVISCTPSNDNIFGLRLQGHLCSDIYRQVMYDMQTSAYCATVDDAVTETQLEPDETTSHCVVSREESREESRSAGTSNPIPAAGRRAWKKAKLFVDEQRVRQRNNKTSMNVRHLGQMVRGVPEVDNTRNELYERYLERPDDWLDGFINCPEHLLQRRSQARLQRMKLSHRQDEPT